MTFLVNFKTSLTKKNFFLHIPSYNEQNPSVIPDDKPLTNAYSPRPGEIQL